MDYLKHIAFFLILGFLSNALLHLIDSKYLIDYLIENLLTIQLALFAINISIIALILSKVQELRKSDNQFNPKIIIESLKASLLEQIMLILVGIIIVSLINSKLFLNSDMIEYFKFTCEVIIFSVFINAMQVIYDTGNGIFLLVEYEDD